MPLTQITGSIWNTSKNVVVNLTQDLPTVATEGIMFVSGKLTTNDGGGGWYKYEAGISRNLADGSAIVDPSGTGVGKGCWERQNFISFYNGINRNEKQLAGEDQVDFRIQNFVFDPNEGELSIYVNGLRLTQDSYEETGPNTVTLSTPLRAEDVVEFIANEQPQPGISECIQAEEVCYDNSTSNLSATNVQDALDELAFKKGIDGIQRNEVLWINSQGQSVFVWEHNVDALDLFLNGVRLDPTVDYSADGSQITLTEPLYGTTDRLIGLSLSTEETDKLYYRNYSWIGPAGATEFTWEHDIPTLQVFLNGSKLYANLDYTSDTHTITLTTALIDNADVLEATCFNPFEVADAVLVDDYDVDQAAQDARITAIEARLDALENP